MRPNFRLVSGRLPFSKAIHKADVAQHVRRAIQSKVFAAVRANPRFKAGPFVGREGRIL